MSYSKIRVACAGLFAAVATTVVGGPPLALGAPAVAVTIDGHGYGHGVGLSQYGALGYALNFGWSAGQILDHYYGGTVSSTVANTPITVRLSRLDGLQTALVHDKAALVIDDFAPLAGQPSVWRSLVAREVAEGRYRVWGRSDANVCPEPSTQLDDPANGWTVVITERAASVTIRPVTDTSASLDVSDLVGVCEPSTGRVRYYRGAIRAVNNSTGGNRTVNEVPLEQYVRSVVGGEVSWGWAAMGGGRGAQALQAQAIAARSYALAENRESVAKTCDNVCQTYRGAAYRSGPAGSLVAQEFGPTDAAVVATTGVVRRYGSPAGAIAYTMYSSSSGGHTAPTSLGFTPVIDEGDSVAGNAGHSWTKSVDVGQIEAAYPSIGAFTAIVVTSRDGFGEWGGRVVTMAVHGTSGVATTTGSAFRTNLGLKSNWFSVRASGTAPTSALEPIGQCGGRVAPPLTNSTVDSTATRFTPLVPRRLVDTRIGLGTDAVALGAGCTLTVDPGVADDATAVVVNVTSVEPSQNGHLTAYPCGAELPLASIVPAVVGRIVPGTAIVPLNEDGWFCLFASRTTDIVIDLSGVYRTDAGDGFQPVRVQRRLDSRGGPLVAGGEAIRIQIGGLEGIPSSATGVAATVHSTNAIAPGFITMWPCDAERPTTSVLNTEPGAAVTNHLQVGLDLAGGVCLFVQRAMHLVVDVSGWFGPTASSEYHALMPYRLLDTRFDVGLSGAFAAGQNRAVPVTGVGNVPAAGAMAVAAEVTSVGATSAGFITVHPCEPTVPAVSMVRNLANTISATTVVSVIDEGGRWCLSTNVAMHVLIDVSGWFG